MFETLEKINKRPALFEFYTASELWDDRYTSKQMLTYHLNEEVDLSSRKGAFVDRSVDWIVSRFGVKAGTKVADFGCGPGLYTTRLARLQADVTGIDFSRNSIQYARNWAAREGLSIDYQRQNYLAFESGVRFDLITMIMCDYCVLSPGQRTQLLGKFDEVLAPEGAILLDVNSVKAFDRRQEVASYAANFMDGFWSAGKYYGFLNTFKYEKEKVILDKYTIVEPDRTKTIYNWFQHFSPDALRAEFAASGFSIQDVYSDVAGTPFDADGDEFAVIAKRV